MTKKKKLRSGDSLQLGWKWGRAREWSKAVESILAGEEDSVLTVLGGLGMRLLILVMTIATM